MSLKRIIDTFKGLNEPEPEDDEDDVEETDSCLDNSWDEYPHWAWKVSSKAIVVARGGHGVLLFYAGPHFRYQVEEEVLEDLEDLGLDNAPMGISVWEGIYITEAGATWDGEPDDESKPKGEFRPLTDAEWVAVREGRNPWRDEDWRGKREGDKRCARCQSQCQAKEPVIQETNCVTCAWANKPGSDLVRALTGGADVWKCSKTQGHHGGVDMPAKAWRMMNVDAKGRPTASGCPGYMRDSLREDCFSCHWTKIAGSRTTCNTPKSVSEAAEWSAEHRSPETGLPFQDGTPPPCPGYSRRR